MFIFLLHPPVPEIKRVCEMRFHRFPYMQQIPLVVS